MAVDAYLERVNAIISLAREQLASARYHMRMLEFLFQQMAKYEGASVKDNLGPNLLQTLHVLQQVVETLGSGELLIRQHAVRLSLQSFFRTADVKDRVISICKSLSRGAKNLMSTGCLAQDIEAITPEPDRRCLDADKAYMFYYLSYILEGQQTTFKLDNSVVSEGIRKEWEEMQADHEARVTHLPLIMNEGPDKLHIGKMIGTGEGGVVYKGRWRNVDVAVKKFVDVDQELSLEALASFFSEVEIQKAMPYPHVVRAFAASKSGLMVMELGKCSMFDMYNGNADLEWPTKAKLLLEAAQGLRFVHDQGVIHHDVKSSNFLIFESSTDDFIVKVADFGLAPVKTESRTLSKTAAPLLTPMLWTAPEILGGKLNTVRSDVFSLGVVMFEVVAQCPPYKGVVSHSLLTGQKRRGADPTAVPCDCPTFLLELMRRCISPSPMKRPTMEDVITGLKELSNHFPYRGQGGDHKPYLKQAPALPDSLDSAHSTQTQRIPAGAVKERSHASVPFAQEPMMVKGPQAGAHMLLPNIIGEKRVSKPNPVFPGERASVSIAAPDNTVHQKGGTTDESYARPSHDDRNGLQRSPCCGLLCCFGSSDTRA